MPRPRLRRPCGGYRPPKVPYGLGKRPENERGLHALGPEARQNTQRPGRVSAQHGLAKLKDIEARAIRHTLEHGVGIGPSVLRDQSEFLQLLVRGQQIPFRSFRQQLQRLIRRLELDLPTPGSEPAHQSSWLNGPNLHPCTVRFDSAHPISALRIPVQTWSENQEQRVAVLPCEQLRES